MGLGGRIKALKRAKNGLAGPLRGLGGLAGGLRRGLQCLFAVSLSCLGVWRSVWQSMRLGVWQSMRQSMGKVSSKRMDRAWRSVWIGYGLALARMAGLSGFCWGGVSGQYIDIQNGQRCHLLKF